MLEQFEVLRGLAPGAVVVVSMLYSEPNPHHRTSCTAYPRRVCPQVLLISTGASREASTEHWLNTGRVWIFVDRV